MRTPLAWRNFINNKPRMLASIGGVAFAVVLMFIEMGFLNGLFDSQSQVVLKLNADLLIVNANKEAVIPKIPFPKKRMIQAQAHPDVVAAYPVYVEELRASWKNSQTHREYPILVFGIDPEDPVFDIPEVQQQSDRLKVADTALIDSYSKEFFGRLEAGAHAELARRNIHVVGTFPLGPDFRADGNVIISSRTFFKCFGDPEVAGAVEKGPRTLPVASKVEFGLLKLRPGADLREVQRSLQSSLPPDVRVLTKDEFIGQVKSYWGTSKPVGYVFGLGTVVGFIIGVTICYQILYTDISDRLPQYATLKAIGYENSFLVGIVLRQSLYLALFGFVPGLLVSFGVYTVLEKISGILMLLTPWRAGTVFVLTVVMCLASAGLAIRRVMNSDPAEVF
jgi:putative ABC transport system permease protein